MDNLSRRAALKVGSVLGLAVIGELATGELSSVSAQERKQKETDYTPPSYLGDKEKNLKVRQSLTSLKMDEEASKKSERTQWYTLYAINKSDWTIIGIWVEGAGQSVIPQPIGRTCSTNCDQCFTEKKYLPVLAVDCNSPAKEFALIIKSQTGQLAQTNKGKYMPDCMYQGEVCCLDL